MAGYVKTREIPVRLDEVRIHPTKFTKKVVTHMRV